MWSVNFDNYINSGYDFIWMNDTKVLTKKEAHFLKYVFGWFF